MIATPEVERTLDDELAALSSYIPLTTLARALGRHVATVYRWTSPRGCRGRVLRSIQTGATRCTTRQWLDDFFAQLTEAVPGQAAPRGASPPPAPLRTVVQSKKAADAAGQKIEKAWS